MDIGAQLRTSREARRLSLEALARTTRVQSRILAAIEQNDASAIPPRPFGRGFVHAYAREVGLDPEQTVRDYFGQFALPAVEVPPSESKGSPAWKLSVPRSFVVPASSAAIALVAVVALIMSRGSSRNTRDADVVGTAGQTAPAAKAAATRPVSLQTPVDKDLPLKQTPVQIPARELNVVIAATAPCWITASADGKRVVYRLLNAGDREVLQGSKDVTIRAGDAGALTWTINGRNAGTFGATGVVRDARVTPANAGAIR